FETVQARHGDIHDHDVRVELLCKSDRLRAVVRLTYDDDGRVLSENRTDAFSEQAVVISQQHANGAHAAFPFCGMNIRIVVPSSGADCTLMAPPSSRTRSSMPTNPNPACVAFPRS